MIISNNYDILFLFYIVFCLWVINLKKANIKKKKSFKFLKRFLILILFLLSFAFTINYLYKKSYSLNNKYTLDYLVNKSYNNNNKYSFIVNSVLKLFAGIDKNNPSSLLTYGKNYSEGTKVIKEEYSTEDDYNPDEYNKITNYIKNDSESVTDPILYIYNTHELETYSNQGLESYNMVPNVMMASSLLSEKLNKLGIKTVWEDTNMDEFIKSMGLPSNELYGASRVFISQAKEKYPSLKYFIDLHRDSVNKDISTIEIDGKNYARVLFVLGTTNRTAEENRVMMDKLSKNINLKYPALSRGIYERETEDWYEAYNQDISKNVILVELGAKDNTITEVLNTIEVLSNEINDCIRNDTE